VLLLKRPVLVLLIYCLCACWSDSSTLSMPKLPAFLTRRVVLEGGEERPDVLLRR
jgi:hypothetical protein